MAPIPKPLKRVMATSEGIVPTPSTPDDKRRTPFQFWVTDAEKLLLIKAAGVDRDDGQHTVWGRDLLLARAAKLQKAGKL